MTELEDSLLETPIAPPITEPPAEGWKADKQGREYVARTSGKSGIIYRQGEETIEQARERDLKPKDKRPRRKAKRPPMPDAPRGLDLKELEATLAEALKSPAMICATFGDEWPAEHFTASGPYLARNLVMASEHNPWLRKKLEEAATGQDAMMKVVSLVGVGGALFSYSIPPIIYWLNLPVPAKTREMFGIPPRREHQPAPNAATSPQQPAPEVPLAA
jgi:hypothetical protein